MSDSLYTEIDDTLLVIIQRGTYHEFLIQISRGADIFNPRMLDVSVFNLRYDMADYLLDQGVMFTQNSVRQFTNAIKSGDVELVRMFIKHGFPLIKHYVELSIHRGHLEVLQLFTEYIHQNYSSITELVNLSIMYKKPNVHRWLTTLQEAFTP